LGSFLGGRRCLRKHFGPFRNGVLLAILWNGKDCKNKGSEQTWKLKFQAEYVLSSIYRVLQDVLSKVSYNVERSYTAGQGTKRKEYNSNKEREKQNKINI